LRADPKAVPNLSGPGQAGGHYRPLNDHDVERIHQTAVRILSEIGMGAVPQVVIDKALEQGCTLNDAGRLCFSASFVEDIIDRAPKRFVLHGQKPEHDFEVGGDRVYYGTGGAAVQVVDRETNNYRPSTLHDVYDFARLVDQLDNVKWFTRCCVATDMVDPLDLDINTAYAIASGTTKHVGTSFAVGDNVHPVIAMFDTMLGGEGRFRQRPFCKTHISPVVSPLRYGEDAVSVMLACIEHGMPINAIIAAQAGATAPAPLAAMLAHTTAETLAGLILVNLFAPGHPVIFSNWPFVIDLRTGAFTGGGGETAVLNAASAQIARFYDLPSGVASSMTDSKLVDAQAGFEKGLTALAAGLAGANMVYESAGMMASLMGASFEAFVVDNEMLSFAQRVLRGVEVTDELLGFDAIHDAVYGEGHFLGHDQTIAAMERDYVYPAIGDRESIRSWQEAGSEDMRTRAALRVDEVLSTHFPDHVDESIDAKIREQLSIRLPRTSMRRQ
jgi:trimethylamine--corrinoid protein Co-methyltransferase